ncbi:type IV secretory system conjugative DNA transfer family protein [Bacillus mycoides]|uniref:hypothetical protein n=1 Tax=Bacillus mycoides TaxID=1405 RepID=UPI0010BEE6B0|nr:hypothetical protein [Bacillus mycoides]TKI37088.1 hypothetical protein FC700_23640 [Bacillus mycoides]
MKTKEKRKHLIYDKKQQVNSQKDKCLNILLGPSSLESREELYLNFLSQDLKNLKNYFNKDIPDNKETIKHLIIAEHQATSYKKIMKLINSSKIPQDKIYNVSYDKPYLFKVNMLSGTLNDVFHNIHSILTEIANISKSSWDISFAKNLKQHIYLLKLHNPEKVPTLHDLLNMYEDTKYMLSLYTQLKKRIIKLKERVEKNCATKQELFEYNLSIETKEWFEEYSITMCTGEDPVVITIRSALHALLKDPIIYNLLFQSESEQLEHFIKHGGVLVINTGNTSSAMSTLVGKCILLRLQQEILSIKEAPSEGISLFIDELQDYITRSTIELLEQAPCYGVSITANTSSFTILTEAYGYEFSYAMFTAFHNFYLCEELSEDENEILDKCISV